MLKEMGAQRPCEGVQAIGQRCELLELRVIDLRDYHLSRSRVQKIRLTCLSFSWYTVALSYLLGKTFSAFRSLSDPATLAWVPSALEYRAQPDSTLSHFLSNHPLVSSESALLSKTQQPWSGYAVMSAVHLPGWFVVG